MLYSRAELVELIRRERKELQGTLVAIAWFASRGNPNQIEQGRYGLLQVPATEFSGKPTELLEPETNIRVGAELLGKVGLVQFCGRELGGQVQSIIELARYLDNEMMATHK